APPGSGPGWLPAPCRPPSIDGCRGTFHALRCIPTLPPQGPNSTSHPTAHHNPPPRLRLVARSREAVKRNFQYARFSRELRPRGCALHWTGRRDRSNQDAFRSEEHTSELQSRGHLVCRLLLEKKK